MFIIGVTGGSGSGKTTFAKKVIRNVSSSSIGILHQDSYYHSSPPKHLSQNGKPNFDHPEAFDWELLLSHLSLLKNGHSVQVPTYDFTTSRRTTETEILGPCQALLVEGIFTLWNPQVRALLDLAVYLHVDADIRFIRRLYRDIAERGRKVDDIVRQYYQTVRPMHHEFLEPCRQFAHLVVGEETDIAAEIVAARLQNLLSERAANSIGLTRKNEDDLVQTSAL